MENYWEIEGLLPNAENLKVVNEFLLTLKNKNRSKYVIKAYRISLVAFFINREVSFLSLTSNDILQWKEELEKEWKFITVQKRLMAIRSFYKFCVEKGYMEKLPFQKTGDNYRKLKYMLPNQENQKVINEFLCCSKNTDKTMKGYRNNLQLFFMEREESFSTLTPDDTKQWIADAYQKELKETTIRIRLCILRSFYNFCVEKGYVDKNPIPYQWEKEDKYWEVNILLPNIENQARINEFLLSLYVAKYSKYTIRGYRYNLQAFFREMKKSYSSIVSDDILQWLIQNQKKYKEQTVTNYLIVLHSFYKFCVEEEYIEKSPMKKGWYPRLPKPVPKYLNIEEVTKVRNHCEREMLRDRVLVEFLLTSGCRRGEVYNLNRTDVDLETRTAIVVGKGQKIRQVHFSVRCSVLLESYLKSRKDEDPALFVTSKGKPRRLTTDWMFRITTKIGKVAGIAGTLHPHRLRHTFATDLLRKGAELSFIGDELGHKQLKTTQIYATLPEQKIITLYRKYMG
ncbi:tyrosine-type recombinase/integrase [Cytobacillus sp. SAFR-174]|uniref:tyrosine-type recombinase/integrase n=1 Tax=Cytobacillus sp. SAFR-174 TaxID=3436868 RepID=UPI003F7E6C68